MAATAGTAKATLFINQIPWTATKEDIAKHFAKAAGCTPKELLPSVRQIVKDGKFNGTAFVDMVGWDAVDRGVELHQSNFKASDGSKRRINVREAVSKQQLEMLGERSKASRGRVLAKAFGGATKAKPPPPDVVYSDEEESATEAATLNSGMAP